MPDYTIPRNSTSLRRYFAWSGALVLLVCSLVTLFFNYAVTVAPSLQELLLLMMWISMPLIWALGAFVAYKKYSSTRYVLTSEALTISKKSWLGSGNKQLYRYDMIVAVNSISRGHGSYGFLEIQIEHQPQVVILEAVSLPDEQARVIKSRIGLTK